MANDFSLLSLGWQTFFQQQLTLDEWGVLKPARIMEQHRSSLEVRGEQGVHTLPLLQSMPPLTVGDWVLLTDSGQFVRALERKSVFKRKAAGSKLAEQLIAANVDTAFIVSSLNEDFNLNRIERFLSGAHQAGTEAVLVLSKLDLCGNAEELREQAQRLDSHLCVEAVNCLSEPSVATLAPWCRPGQTIVVIGSSGAGKSTLSNALLGAAVQDTGSIREDDAKGRHTTTRRSLMLLPSGGLILDTPGMREMQLADCEEGVAATFADIEELATQCRFGDCSHDSEPGCAVREAIENEQLDERRLHSYRKLSREQAMNAASLAQRRAVFRKQSKNYKRIINETKQIKRGE